MSRETVQASGTVISREMRGDSSLRLHLLSPEYGRMLLIKRLSQKRSSAAPDLFDDADILASRAELPGVFFLQEYHLLRRRTGIASRYSNFQCACQLVSILDKNLTHAEHVEALHALGVDALDAWDTHAGGHLILLKALYRLARDEGYAVKEHWFAQLPASLRAHALEALNTPVADWSAKEASLEKLCDSLCQWLEHHTDILT